jgi:hypothetical protein
METEVNEPKWDLEAFAELSRQAREIVQGKQPRKVDSWEEAIRTADAIRKSLEGRPHSDSVDLIREDRNR